MRDSYKKKIAPIAWAGAFILFLAILLAAVFFPLIRELFGVTSAVWILIAYSAVVLLVIGGIGAALIQRLNEIDSGEEEEAKKY